MIISKKAGHTIPKSCGLRFVFNVYNISCYLSCMPSQGDTGIVFVVFITENEQLCEDPTCIICESFIWVWRCCNNELIIDFNTPTIVFCVNLQLFDMNDSYKNQQVIFGEINYNRKSVWSGKWMNLEKRKVWICIETYGKEESGRMVPFA